MNDISSCQSTASNTADTMSGFHPHGCGCAGCATQQNPEAASAATAVTVDPTKGVIIQGAMGDIAPTISMKVATAPLPRNDGGESLPDTVPGDTSTTASVSVGGFASGTIETAGDRDWFEIDLTANVTYVFGLEGTGGTPVADTVLRLYDNTGTLIAEDDDGGDGFFSALSFVPSSGGTYYLEAAGFQDIYTGDYTLTADEFTGSGALPVPSLQGTLGLLGQDQSNIEFYFADTGVLTNYGAALSSTSHASWTGEEDWSATEKDIVRAALDYIETLIDVTFVETTVQGDADLDFVKNDDSGSLGTAGSLIFGGGAWRESSIRMNHTINSRWDVGKDEGGQGYETLVHEIGHALGLGHTHDTGLGSQVLEGMSGFSSFSGGALGFNDPVNSIMAYRDGWAAEGTSTLAYGNRGNFGAWDQQALINLYGEATPTEAGGNTYILPETSVLGTFFETLHDTGGTDVISAGGSALDAVIDLRPATLDLNVETSGGPVSHLKTGSGVVPGGFTIAAGTIIENALGGSGDDKIVGNDVANDLAGLAGADTLLGGGGDDTLTGGTGGDVLNGGTGNNTASYANSTAAVFVDVLAETASGGEATGDTISNIANLIGSVHNDRLTGGNEANDFTGGGGLDTLNGGGGDDTLNGQDGDDLLRGGNGGDNIDGGNSNDSVFGNGGDDVITGGSGLDTVFGGTDNDTIDAGDGNDSVLGQGGNDEIVGGKGEDVLRGGSGDDSIEGGANDDQIFGNGNNDTLEGGGGNDVIQGAAGADVLIGNVGDDNLTGGIGADRLDGGTGNDTMNGGGNDGVRDIYTFLLGYEADRINGYEQGTDELELDQDLWLDTNPGGLTEQEVIDTFGTLNGSSTILTLDFGGGDILEVQNAAGITQATLGLDVTFV